MNPFRKLAAFVVNEPVVHVAGTLSAGLTWLFTYVSTGWDPSTHQQELAGLATGGAYLLALVARQFVTPTAKSAPVAQVVPLPAADEADPVFADEAPAGSDPVLKD